MSLEIEQAVTEHQWLSLAEGLTRGKEALAVRALDYPLTELSGECIVLTCQQS